jgi:hypothetical protein
VHTSRLWWAVPVISWPAGLTILNLVAGHTGWGMCAAAVTAMAAVVAIGEPQEMLELA